MTLNVLTLIRKVAQFEAMCRHPYLFFLFRSRSLFQQKSSPGINSLSIFAAKKQIAKRFDPTDSSFYGWRYFSAAFAWLKSAQIVGGGWGLLRPSILGHHFDLRRPRHCWPRMTNWWRGRAWRSHHIVEFVVWVIDFDLVEFATHFTPPSWQTCKIKCC